MGLAIKHQITDVDRLSGNSRALTWQAQAADATEGLCSFCVQSATTIIVVTEDPNKLDSPSSTHYWCAPMDFPEWKQIISFQPVSFFF